MSTHGPQGPGWLARWRIYLHERFPPLQYAVALALFSTTTLVCLRAARGRSLLPDAYPWWAGFAIVFLLFLQLRVLDEFKDQAEDAAYRPQLPVPRGLVSLRSLGRLWLLAAAVQLALAAGLGALSVACLALVLAYTGLMRVEFFAPAWLRARPLAYLLSHMLVVPLAAVLVAGTESSAAELAAARPALLPYLGFCFLGFCVFELGRKIRSAPEEIPGVDTYSSRWGRRKAALAWALALWGAAGAGTATASVLGAGRPFALAGGMLAVFGSMQARRFVGDPTALGGRVFVAASTVWFVGAHLGLIAALVFRRA